jgi:hypothetical protein
MTEHIIKNDRIIKDWANKTENEKMTEKDKLKK